MNNKTTPIV